jgi:hypothetical protein
MKQKWGLRLNHGPTIIHNYGVSLFILWEFVELFVS